MSCCDGIRLDGRTLALLEHVLVPCGASRAAPFSVDRGARVATTSSTISAEQFAARELVRDWAAGSGATEAVRDIEQGEPKAWQPVFEGLADLGLFGVAVPEDCGGAGGSIEDLAAMVEEAARALVPGPVATTALATLVVSDPTAARGPRVRGAHRRGCLRQRRRVRRGGRRRCPGPCRGCSAASPTDCCWCRPARRGCSSTLRLRAWPSSRCRPPTSPGRWRGWCSPRLRPP